jgi:hypothetical protein
MVLLNASLLIGALCVAVPIILHMTMRPRPRRLIFPAIRFVVPRREANQRRLNWRRWLLLALRCLAILLVAAALARPSVASHMLSTWVTAAGVAAMALLIGLLAAASAVGDRGRWLTWGLSSIALLLLAGASFLGLQALGGGTGGIGRQTAPVAAVLIFDTSPRMDYRLENKTRLQQAGDTATWLLGQLPDGSEVAVLDSRTRTAVFSVDPASAAKAVSRLQSTFAPRPLAEVLIDALQLADTSNLERRELYVFSDLNAVAWRDESMRQLKQRFADRPDTALYVIDVGVDQPSNVALGDLRIAGEVLPRDGELVVDVDLQSEGVAGEKTVELLLEEPDPTRPLIRDGRVELPMQRQRGRDVRNLQAGERQSLQFHVRGLPPGIHQGQVRILGQDGLAFDNVRYFTIQVQEAWPVLLAGPQGASLRFMAESLAPFEMREDNTARFDCVQARLEDLDDVSLDAFAAVCLLDPTPLSDEQWQRLAAYVGSGHGLAIALGHHAGDGAAFNVEQAQQLLPGPLARQWRGGRDVFLAPVDHQHPITSEFRNIASAVPWQLYPVLRHWDLEPLADDASVVIPFSNGQPALIERSLGQGKVVVVTTPLSDVARPAGRSPWNELAFGENPWPQFVLVNELMLYLVASGEARLNYLTGQVVRLPRREQVDPERFQLFPPVGDPYDVLAGDGGFTVRFTEQPGAYRLKGNRGNIVIRGFAANVPEDASRLERVDREWLDEIFGLDRAQALRERQQIERAQGRQRVGREFYPLLVVLAAMVLGLEHVLANRFYRRSEV